MILPVMSCDTRQLCLEFGVVPQTQFAVFLLHGVMSVRLIYMYVLSIVCRPQRIL
jgi:hypothetical protein